MGALHPADARSQAAAISRRPDDPASARPRRRRDVRSQREISRDVRSPREIEREIDISTPRTSPTARPCRNAAAAVAGAAHYNSVRGTRSVPRRRRTFGDCARLRCRETATLMATDTRSWPSPTSATARMATDLVCGTLCTIQTPSASGVNRPLTMFSGPQTVRLRGGKSSPLSTTTLSQITECHWTTMSPERRRIRRGLTGRSSRWWRRQRGGGAKAEVAAGRARGGFAPPGVAKWQPRWPVPVWRRRPPIAHTGRANVSQRASHRLGCCDQSCAQVSTRGGGTRGRSSPQGHQPNCRRRGRRWRRDGRWHGGRRRIGQRRR